MKSLIRVSTWLYFLLSLTLLTGCAPLYDEKLEEYRQRLNPQLLIGTIVYIFIILVGPSIAEGFQSTVVKKFDLSKSVQITTAKILYFSTIVVLFLISFADKYLSIMHKQVWLLLAATLYPFLVHFLPSIEADDKERRKAAVNQIKSLFMLIFVFYVISRLLSVDGFGGLFRLML
jgi:hypothetical protein